MRTGWERSFVPFVLGVALWLAVRLATTPGAATFFDEVGYVGHARLLGSGALHATATTPGVWFEVGGSLRPLYPPVWPTVLAPFVALSPRLASLPAALAAVAASWTFALLLRRLGVAPVWGLALLAHPTVGLFARVAMPDVAALALVFSFWLLLDRGSGWASGFAGAGAILLKPTAVLVVAPFLIVDRYSRGRTARGWRAPALLVTGAAVLAAALPNAYATSLAAREPFSLAHLATSGVVLAALLLAAPPGLAFAVVPLWRARAFGAIAGASSLVGALVVYYFVDRGRSWAETLVVGPRLALPAFGILLVGWTAAIARALARVPPRAVAIGCLLAPALVQSVVAVRHEAILDDSVRVRLRAEAIARGRGFTAIDVTPAAQKALILTDLELRSVAEAGTSELFVCATRPPSWRELAPEGSCDPAPGWRVEETIGPYVIQVRVASDASWAAPGSPGRNDSRRASTEASPETARP